MLGPRELADQPVLLGGDGGGLALGGLGGRGRALLRLPGEGGAADLVGLGLLRLVREDGGQRVGGGEALVVGLQRRRGALEGGVLVEHALGPVGAHHRVDGRQVTALLVGLRDQGTDPVALAGDGTAGTGRLGPGLAGPLPGLVEPPQGAVVGLGRLLGLHAGLLEPLVRQQHPGLDHADVASGPGRPLLGPSYVALAGHRGTGTGATGPGPAPGLPRRRRHGRQPQGQAERERCQWCCRTAETSHKDPFVCSASRFLSARAAWLPARTGTTLLREEAAPVRPVAAHPECGPRVNVSAHRAPKGTDSPKETCATTARRLDKLQGCNSSNRWVMAAVGRVGRLRVGGRSHASPLSSSRSSAGPRDDLPELSGGGQQAARDRAEGQLQGRAEKGAPHGR